MCTDTIIGFSYSSILIADKTNHLTFILLCVTDQDALCERLKRAQDLSLDDQRGQAVQNTEMPDFLRNVNDNVLERRESAPPTIGRDVVPDAVKKDMEKIRKSLQSDCRGDGSVNGLGVEAAKGKSRHSRDLMAEIDEYIESINENFAAYTRESRQTSTPQSKSVTQSYAETPQPEAIISSNKSFSEDGIVPSNDEADSFFQGSSPDEGDSTDVLLTDRSLRDIGFTYSQNKYLAKSRNFVNHRNQYSMQISPPASVQLTEPAKLGMQFSPKTPRNFHSSKSAPVLDSTLVQNSNSPYNSDSSVDKDGTPKFDSGKHNPRKNRHTFLHSPITSSSDESFLSTVDTDSSALKHSTPKGPVSSSITPKALLFTSENQSSLGLSTEEVTFV